MREMHKWKDKVELSLDNRQIFFLFFGLSVIGCFVFALGVMTGRRIDWDPGQQAAALGGQDSLELLELEGEDERFAFQQGLAQADTDAIPPTRDPQVPPRDEREVKAEKAEQAEQAEAGGGSPTVAKKVEQREAEKAELEAKVSEQQAALAKTSPKAATAAKAPAKPAPSDAGAETDAEAKAKARAEADAKAGRRFTLQMKAFSDEADATKLADKLRSNGHEVRIESHDVRGRTWHRVRVGQFDTWEDGLAAKLAFEKSEKIIAYVVSL